MAIEGFDYKAFAKDLAGQANGVIPPDISDADKPLYRHITPIFLCFYPTF